MRGIWVAAAAMSGAPLLALSLLAVSGAAATGPTLLAMAGLAAASFALALLWTRDLTRVVLSLHRVAGGRGSASPRSLRPLLPSLSNLATEAKRLLDAEAARANADDPAAQHRFLGIMAEQAARMHRLIDDLLDLSRIELIEHQWPTDRVSISELAGQVVAGLEPALLARKAGLTMEINPGLAPVIGDADQLTQVLQNLLENALKHGGGGVSIRLVVEPARPGEHWPGRPGIVLTVADTGPGIAREHLPRLTERFYRVDAGRSRAAGGTGLGLAIVKHIVNRHRGQLRIESAVGSGTRVRVWLPTQ